MDNFSARCRRGVARADRLSQSSFIHVGMEGNKQVFFDQSQKAQGKTNTHEHAECPVFIYSIRLPLSRKQCKHLIDRLPFVDKG